MHTNATERCEIDRWLAGFFLREMDRDALELYRSADGARVLGQLAAVPALRPLVDSLRNALAEQSDTEVLRLDLAAAYGRLFLTGGAQAVPLHASAYLSEKGLLMQAPMKESQAILAGLGLVCPPGFREPADHVGIQLSILAELAGGAKPDGLSELSYLTEHLLTWVPAFADRCTRVSPVPFYADLGVATVSWLRATQAHLSGEMSDA